MACIDEIYVNDGACGTTARDDVFPHFTALPPPIDYARTCIDEMPPCAVLEEKDWLFQLGTMFNNTYSAVTHPSAMGK